jgi:DNA-binding LacI/PurR family transcriptional regulator
VKSKDHAWSQAFRERGIPTLDSTDVGDPQMTAQRMMQAAMEYFKQRGKRKIALIGWRNPWIRGNPFPEVFFEAAGKAGIPVDSRLVDFAAEGWVPGMGWERFRDIWLSGPEKPNGLLVLDDMLYRDCEKAIESLGVKVPTQLDIIVRSSDAAALAPQFPIVEMKTFVEPTAEMYADAMKLLIEGRSIPKAEMHWVFEENGDPEPRLVWKAKARKLPQ